MMVICRFPASNHRSPRVGKPTPGGAGMSGPSTCLTCGDLFLKHHHVSDSVKSCCQLELGRRVQINARLESRGGLGGRARGGHIVLKWAVADGHDSGLIAGCYADHTLHLLPTLQTHCCWETQCISLVGCHRVFEKDSGECCEHQNSQQQKKTLSQIFVVFKTNVKTV